MPRRPKRKRKAQVAGVVLEVPDVLVVLPRSVHVAVCSLQIPPREEV